MSIGNFQSGIKDATHKVEWPQNMFVFFQGAPKKNSVLRKMVP